MRTRDHSKIAIALLLSLTTRVVSNGFVPTISGNDDDQNDLRGAGPVRRSRLPVGAANVKGDGNAKFGVRLLTSYATRDHGTSFWVYAAPSFSAVESAAQASGAPFESIVLIPETLYPN